MNYKNKFKYKVENYKKLNNKFINENKKSNTKLISVKKAIYNSCLLFRFYYFFFSVKTKSSNKKYMQQLFDKVKKISSEKISIFTELDEADLLKQHIEIIFETVISNYEKNIECAANSTQSQAYLLIYMKNKMHGNIQIKKLLDPPDNIQHLLVKYTIKSLLEKLNEFFLPFIISHKNTSNDTGCILVTW